MTTIITTCMGRLEHLKRSLPTWLEHTDAKILVVDYSCPDKTADWVRSLGNERVTCIEVAADQSLYSRPIFNKARALNVALPRVTDDITILLDADTLIDGRELEKTASTLPVNKMAFVAPLPEHRDLTGVLVVHTMHLRQIRGFDEGMVGWGAEDLDVRLRLYLELGLAPLILSSPLRAMLSSIEHTDELRVAHYTQKDLARSNDDNVRRMLGKHASSAKAVYALVQDPEIKLLLGSGLGPRSSDR
jgi:hypothetical protein